MQNNTNISDMVADMCQQMNSVRFGRKTAIVISKLTEDLRECSCCHTHQSSNEFKVEHIFDDLEGLNVEVELCKTCRENLKNIIV